MGIGGAKIWCIRVVYLRQHLKALLVIPVEEQGLAQKGMQLVLGDRARVALDNVLVHLRGLAVVTHHAVGVCVVHQHRGEARVFLSSEGGLADACQAPTCLQTRRRIHHGWKPRHTDTLNEQCRCWSRNPTNPVHPESPPCPAPFGGTCPRER